MSEAKLRAVVRAYMRQHEHRWYRDLLQPEPESWPECTCSICPMARKALSSPAEPEMVRLLNWLEAEYEGHVYERTRANECVGRSDWKMEILDREREHIHELRHIMAYIGRVFGYVKQEDGTWKTDGLLE